MSTDRLGDQVKVAMTVVDEPAERGARVQSATDSAAAFAELERGVRAALETYSNVHRGTGHYSMASSALFERARDIVLDYLGLDADSYVVVFCTPWRAATLKAQLKPASFHLLSSQGTGLPLGLRAFAVQQKALPKGVPIQTGGDAVQLVARNYVVWADAPYKFEAGTPSVINVIALGKALTVMQRLGNDVFERQDDGASPAAATAEILYQDELLGPTGNDLLLELRKSLVGRDVRVPTAAGDVPHINLDNGASTPAFAPIWEAVRQTWRQPERVRREIVREVKQICARFVGAPLAEYEVIFAGNTTEALNIVAQSLSREPPGDIQPVVLNTLLEHHSNELPWRYVPAVSLVQLPVDREGFVDLGELERLLREYNQECGHGAKRIRLVAVSGASNVLGSFNDLATISRIAHKYGARILVDGAQLVAHRKVEMARHEIDYLAFSGHKMYAPFGSGALVVRRGLLCLDPIELTMIQSSGEENVVGIAAMGKAMVILQRVGIGVIEEEERALTRRVLRGLAGIPGVQIYGVRDPASPRFQNRGGIVVFEVQSVPRNLVAKELGEQGGIGVRDGCFCAHFIVRDLIKIHPVRTFVGAVGLKVAPQFFRPLLPGLVRVSFGIENDERDVDTLVEVLGTIASRPRSRTERLLASTHNGTPWLPQTKVQDQMRDYAAACATRVYSFARDGPLNGGQL